MRSLQILRAGKVSEQRHLAATLAPVKSIPPHYVEMNLKLVREIGAMDEELRLINEELKNLR
jgi:hypothetical protein